jgi:hypothetical protein
VNRAKRVRRQPSEVSNASRVSRARQWRERCGEADAAQVTLPEATAPGAFPLVLSPKPSAPERASAPYAS